MDESDAAILAEVRRGGTIESLHRGHVAVIDGAGRMLLSAGNPSFVTFLRSSAKFHQALPLVASGVAERFGLTLPEIAIACSSHAGEEKHVIQVRSILRKIGLSEDHLRCGIHLPFSSSACETLVRDRKTPTPIHNNCSGKHAGMLALALRLGAPLTEYLDVQHPVQRGILKLIAEFAGLREDQIIVAMDGCSAPTFAISVEAMARMFAKFVNPKTPMASACERIAQAATEYPDLISNDGEADCELMREGAGTILAKGGAEAVLCVAVKPGNLFPDGLGVAVKIEDGMGKRVRGLVTREVLRQIGILSHRAEPHIIENHRGIRVGEIVSRVPLKFH